MWSLTDFSVWQEASQVQISRNMLKCPDTFAYVGCTLHTWDGCWLLCSSIRHGQHEAGTSKMKTGTGGVADPSSSHVSSCLWFGGTMFYHKTLYFFLCYFCIFLCYSLPAAFGSFWACSLGRHPHKKDTDIFISTITFHIPILLSSGQKAIFYQCQISSLREEELEMG